MFFDAFAALDDILKSATDPCDSCGTGHVLEQMSQVSQAVTSQNGKADGLDVPQFVAALNVGAATFTAAINGLAAGSCLVVGQIVASTYWGLTSPDRGLLTERCSRVAATRFR